MNLKLRQVQLASLLVFIVGAALLAPWFLHSPLALALQALLAIHLLRGGALMGYGARRQGFELSDEALREIVGLDVLGAALALIGMVALSLHSVVGLWFAALVAIETVLDLVVAIRRRRREPLNAEPKGPLWWFLAVYVPLMVVSLPVLTWLLVARWTSAR